MEQLSTKFAMAVQKAMEEKNVSIKDLAEATETTYEHCRKITKGLAFPSKHIMSVFCQKLGLDRKQMDKFVTEDRIKSKYGGTAVLLAGKNPEMDRIETAWAYLSTQHKAELTSIAEMWAKTDHVGTKTKAKSA